MPDLPTPGDCNDQYMWLMQSSAPSNARGKIVSSKMADYHLQKGRLVRAFCQYIYSSLKRGKTPTIPSNGGEWVRRGQILLFFLSVTSCATTLQPPVVPCKLLVLPLAPNSQFQLKKVRQFFNEPSSFIPTSCEAINFERNLINHGAISQNQFNQLRGNYFSFLWRTSTRANIIVRFEYHQNSLGNKTQALECFYPNALGSYESKFRVVGEDYLKFGRVVSWRALLIVEGKVVALRRSFLWRQ